MRKQASESLKGVISFDKTADRLFESIARPERDDTGYISPYRARLKKRVEQENEHDSSGLGSTIGRGSHGGQTARAELTEIHSRTKKKDGGKRGS